MTSPPASEQGQLIHLERHECLRLLAENRVGRLAVNLGDGPPVIRPVNYVFDERSQCVVFRTGTGSKLHATIRAKAAAFEVDGLDHEGRTGWSVIVHGIVEEVTDKREIGGLEQLGVIPWSADAKDHWVRLRARTVTGRRIVSTGSDPDRGSSK